jgi:peptidyl-prolyl cis-trans isomerase C
VLVAARVTALPDGAALRISGTVITTSDLKHRLEVLKALYGIAPPTDPKGQDTFRRQSAEAVALSVVLDRAAHDEGITVEEKDARDALGKMIAERFPDGLAGFAQLLSDVGASEQDVVDEIKRQQATSALFDKVATPERTVSEADARLYFDQHPANFLQPAARHLRNIVVPSQDDANDVLAKLRAGGDFAALAKQFSLDQSTRDAGGDLGFVSADQADGDFAGPAFSTAVGAVFGPVRCAHGWNVGQVLEQRPAVALAFDQVKVQLRSELAAAAAKTRWRHWVTQRVKAADIEYADEYRPADPAAPLPAEPLAEARR